MGQKFTEKQKRYNLLIISFPQMIAITCILMKNKEKVTKGRGWGCGEGVGVGVGVLPNLISNHKT